MKRALIMGLAALGAAARGVNAADFASSIFYLNLGAQSSFYPDRTNAFLNDHGGPGFELEFGVADTKLTGYFSPWTVHPARTTKIWNDTLYDYDTFNPIKAGVLLGSRFWISRRAEWGFNTGLEWVTFDGFHDKEQRESRKITMPTVLGLVVGVDYHRDLLIFGNKRLGYKLSYRYSTADYRVFNKSLDDGTHEWSALFSLGGKSFVRRKAPRAPMPRDEETEEPLKFY